MSNRLPFYKLYPKDFDTNEEVRLLDMREAGLYIFALNHAWVNDGLPKDPAEIGRLLRVAVKDFRTAWPRVSRCFYECPDGRLRNRRQEEEREKAKVKSDMATKSVRARYDKATNVPTNEDETKSDRSQNVAPRALARADSDSDSDSDSGSGFDSFSSDSHAVSFLGGSGGNGQSHNIANTAQEVGIPPPRRKPVVVPDTPVMRMCREWLEIYPNQVDVGRASQEWVSLVKDESHAREVLAGTKRYIESGAWRDSNGELVPNKAKNPMYFLRDGNYRDNPPPFKPRATNCRAVIDDSQLFPKVTPKPDWMRKAKPV